MQKIRPDLDIGKNINKLRKGLKLTQDDVVGKMQLRGIDITRSTYGQRVGRFT